MMFFKFADHDPEASLPPKFTFPFYYTPHPLAVQAAEELQGYLRSQDDFVHNFGLDRQMHGIVIGKMFGVLVVRNKAGEIGYLRAFSGKLADSNEHMGFVPPVFDVLHSKGFYKKEEAVVTSLNAQVEALETSNKYIEAKSTYLRLQAEAERLIGREKALLKEGKKRRKAERAEAVDQLDSEAYQALEGRLREESIKTNYKLRDYIKYWDQRLAVDKNSFETIDKEISRLKKERKERSTALQSQIFSHYKFLNSTQEKKSLLD